MNGKAWEILTQEEQIALTLSINHGKSSWQAGEIMEKAHYKYLEIQARAKMFFKIFTLYFQKSGEQLIPDNSDMTWDFQEFILCTLQNRKGYRETIKIIGKESKLCHKKAKERVEALKGYMAWLDNHEDPVHKELHDLIKEFDRWNNFRILPEDLQEPSAFKRRNKTRLLKHLKNLKNLEAFLVDRLINKFTAPRTYNRKVKYSWWACHLSSFFFEREKYQSTRFPGISPIPSTMQLPIQSGVRAPTASVGDGPGSLCGPLLA